MNASPNFDLDFMSCALAIARIAGRAGEVPVGAIGVRNGLVLGMAANAIEAEHDATSHAELRLLRTLSRRSSSFRLSGITIYTTLEPCPMCAGALVLARVDRVVYGARDPKKGADGSVFSILQNDANNHRIEVTSGVLRSECTDLLTGFFHARRSGGK